MFLGHGTVNVSREQTEGILGTCARNYKGAKHISGRVLGTPNISSSVCRYFQAVIRRALKKSPRLMILFELTQPCMADNPM